MDIIGENTYRTCYWRTALANMEQPEIAGRTFIWPKAEHSIGLTTQECNAEQFNMKVNYDRKARTGFDFGKNDLVWVASPPVKNKLAPKWVPGKVLKREGLLTYSVLLNGCVTR